MHLVEKRMIIETHSGRQITVTFSSGMSVELFEESEILIEFTPTKDCEAVEIESAGIYRCIRNPIGIRKK